MITLDTHGQFVTTEGKRLGVYVTVKNRRHQYRDATGTLYGSGMAPGEFVKRFWMRDDYVAQPDKLV